ncbi:MAG: RluA family pseudouridine synthase [Marinicella sp.]
MPNISNNKPILVATAHDAGQRLDNYLLKHRKQLDKATCYKLIRKGQIRINGKRVQPSQKLLVNDQIRMPPFVFFVETTTHQVSTAEQEVLVKHIVFEDSDYVLINKPAGLPCHTGTGHKLGVIEIITSIPDYKTVQLAHRLDKETSGCLLLSKTRQALLVFQQAMKQHEVKKTYLAVLVGQLQNQLEVNQPLDTQHRINNIRHVIVSDSGQSALTQFNPIKCNAKYTLTQCDIRSGRTHQIRVHAKHIGHAVLGDRFYGKKQADLSRQLFLHAHKLQFNAYSFVVPMPQSFDQVMV